MVLYHHLCSIIISILSSSIFMFILAFNLNQIWTIIISDALNLWKPSIFTNDNKLAQHIRGGGSVSADFVLKP